MCVIGWGIVVGWGYVVVGVVMVVCSTYTYNALCICKNTLPCVACILLFYIDIVLHHMYNNILHVQQHSTCTTTFYMYYNILHHQHPGFMIYPSLIPAWWRWATYINPLYWYAVRLFLP